MWIANNSFFPKVKNMLYLIVVRHVKSDILLLSFLDVGYGVIDMPQH